MPVTELVFAPFKPETAQEALGVLRTSLKHFDGSPGLSFRRVGHILRHNGQHVSPEYRSVLSIEWESPENFHAFYPASERFAAFVQNMMPYLAGKPAPQLFEPISGYATSDKSFVSGVTQIFTGTVAEKAEVDSAWDALIKAVKESDGQVPEWSGNGIESTEGAWLGVLGWNSVEHLDALTKVGGVAEAMKKLKGLNGLTELVAKFD